MSDNPNVAALREKHVADLQFLRNDCGPDEPYAAAIDAAIAALSAQGEEPVAWAYRSEDPYDAGQWMLAGPAWEGEPRPNRREVIPLYLHPAPPGSDAVTEAHELPELPQCWTGSPVTVTWAEDGERTTREVYTAEQMRQYALAALAARTGKGE